jgi:hypothetical protein
MSKDKRLERIENEIGPDDRRIFWLLDGVYYAENPIEGSEEIDPEIIQDDDIVIEYVRNWGEL